MKFLNLLLLTLSIGLLTACGGEPPQKKTNSNAPKVTPKENTTSDTQEKKDTPKVLPTPKAHLDKAKKIIAAVSDDAIAGVDAKKKFKQVCAACHGFTGDLNVNGAKDLTVSKVSLVESVAQVYHGKGLMTPFKGILKDEEIVAVAKYIETLRK